MSQRYNAALADRIERAWQARWADRDTFRQPNPGEAGFDPSKPKFYCLDMFPYPSGAGLHVGHPEGYTATDIICRYRLMQGQNVLHPMGWDAFGLPAEQYAIRTGVHPAITTREAIDNFRRQLQRFGFCYDWSREFATIDEDYYRWTQWIFLQVYESWYDVEAQRARPITELVEAFESGSRPVTLNPDASEHTHEEKAEVFDWKALDEIERHRVVSSWRLAYVGEQTVNWCPMLGTALANEEVIDGRSERGDYPVFRKPLKQWLFRITAYADRLQRDLDPLDWPTSTKTQQREWIGRSEGAEIDFELAGLDRSLRVYTTRPDTIFGATYMVVAPEHPLVAEVLSTDPDDGATIRTYVDEAKNRSDVERQENKEKTGVALGIDAVNPATGERIPVWTADYVLMGYGHGAIMAVPAHDERDFEFAMSFGLPIRDVVYSRIQSAVRYFVEHATDAEARIWPSALADFLGWVTSSNATPETFYDALNTVRTRRPATADCDVAAETVPSDKAGSIGSRRGTVKLVWMDTIESMGFDDFDDLKRCFEARSFIRRSGSASPDAGFAVNSSNDSVSIDGLPRDRAIARIIEWLESKEIGRKTVNFRLRDWLFSRQRYWGEPFPVVWDDRGLHHGAHALPVRLPEMEDYKPEVSDDPKPLLAKATDWLHTTAGEAGARDLPDSTPVTRESNTMPGWAGSCWYHLRYTDRNNDERYASSDAERYWMLSRKDGSGTPGSYDDSCHVGGVDLYIGGAEHAVLHLLYARFWHKVLFDLGHTPTPEPFGRLFHQGLITSFAYTDKTGRLIPVDEVEEKAEGEFVLVETGEPVRRITAKMSKSLKNVINPDDVIADYGADTFRLYEMYMGPLEQTKPWNTDDISGMYRFLQRAWRLCIDEESGEITAIDTADEAIEKLLHRTVDKVGGDIERLAFNTAIAALIEFVNAASKAGGLTSDQIDRFARAMCPFAPHLAEEIAWRNAGSPEAFEPISRDAWPVVDPSLLKDDEIEIPVQIKGKVKARIMIPADADQKTIEAIALADEQVVRLIDGKELRKVIVVPGRMVNLVV